VLQVGLLMIKNLIPSRGRDVSAQPPDRSEDLHFLLSKGIGDKI